MTDTAQEPKNKFASYLPKKEEEQAPPMEVVDAITKERINLPHTWNDLATKPEISSPQQIRFWLQGESVAGKTSFLASNPKAIILDFEDRIGDVPEKHRHAHAIPVREWETFTKVIDKLVSEKDKKVFHHVAFDTSSAMWSLLIPYLEESVFKCSVGDVPHGGGWAATTDRIVRALYNLQRAGYGWTVATHLVRDKERNLSVKITQTLGGRLMEMCQVQAVLTRVDRGNHVLSVDTSGSASMAQSKCPYIEHMKPDMRVFAGTQWYTWEQAYRNAAMTANDLEESQCPF